MAFDSYASNLVSGDTNGTSDVFVRDRGPAMPVTVDDTSYAIQYDDWRGAADPLASGGGFRAASSAGQTITYRTAQPARAVGLITYRGPDQGKTKDSSTA